MNLLHDTLIKWTGITTKYLFEDVQLFKLHGTLINWTGITTLNTCLQMYSCLNCIFL